jgi:ABC-type multidrug transport system fused ATPase/permease subunit
LVSFSAVAKRYPGGQEALKAVSFSLEAGELAFLTGRSGAGKSTLLKLIPAIERPSAGSVVVNGQNVASLKPAAIPYLRRNIGLVFQDQKLLYDRSVYENVMLPLAFSAHAPREAARRARAALDKVNLLAREKANPIQLSGGEQQRLAIARVLLKAPPILVLDEATSALDTTSERLVQQALENATRRRTTIAIAHRLSTVLGADLILAVDAGRVVERGTHAELLARGGLYARLYTEQFAGGAVECRCADGVLFRDGTAVVGRHAPGERVA